MKPALLVIDVQREFYNNGPTTGPSLERAIEVINRAITLFRERSLPVVCVQNMEIAKNFVPGADGFDLPEHLSMLPSDLHIYKTYKNSFCKTTLEVDLRRLGIDTVIITGYCAEHCVLSTYRGADDLDLTPILLRGGIAGDIPENIRFVENINDLISFGALKKALG